MNKFGAMIAIAVAAVSVSGASAAPFLAVDVNDRTVVDTPNSVTGFSAYTLTGTTPLSTPSTQVINGYSVTMTAFDAGLDETQTTAGDQLGVGQIDDRDRATPTDGGSLSYAQIYDDFVFAGTTTGFTGGIDLAVSGGSLLPNTQYAVALYAFDSSSTPAPRSANWLDGNNANALVLAAAFDGTVLPTTNEQYRFTGVATTDAAGALLLRGRNTTATPATTGAVNLGVFVNAFEISEVPEPASATVFVAIAAFASMRRRRRD